MGLGVSVSVCVCVRSVSVCVCDSILSLSPAVRIQKLLAIFIILNGGPSRGGAEQKAQSSGAH